LGRKYKKEGRETGAVLSKGKEEGRWVNSPGGRQKRLRKKKMKLVVGVERKEKERKKSLSTKRAEKRDGKGANVP